MSNFRKKQAKEKEKISFLFCQQNEARKTGETRGKTGLETKKTRNKRKKKKGNERKNK